MDLIDCGQCRGTGRLVEQDPGDGPRWRRCVNCHGHGVLKRVRRGWDQLTEAEARNYEEQRHGR